VPIVADAAVAVRGDFSKFNQGMKGAGQQADGLGAKLKSALSPGALLGAAGIGFGVAQLTGFISDATAAAAEYEDSLSAVGVIFGEEMIPQMEAWGESAHENFGASKQDALAAANVIATLGKSAGLAGQDLVNFSQEMVQLGGDLASMFGGTTQDAITAVGAALRGESEPIRRYGVLLDDATLRQKAFEMGLISTIKNALTPQQRVLAAQAEILDQTSDAQGDFLRTSDGMANSQRDLAAQLENVNIEIGQKLLPIMLDLVNFVKDTGIPIMREFIELLDFGDVNSAEGIPGLEQVEDALNAASESSFRLRDSLTGEKWRVLDVAELLGGPEHYMQARDKILDAMEDLQVGHEEATNSIIENWHKTEAGTQEMTTAIHSDLMAAGGNIDDAAAEMADGIPAAMEDAKEEAEEIARVTPGSLADQLRAGLDDYDEALDELTEIATSSVSDLAERQKIEGILASQELTDALNSDSTRTRLLAMELVNDLVSDYELIAPGALEAVKLVNPELADVMGRNLNLVETAAGDIVVAVETPLSTICGDAYPWGYNIGDSIAKGMWDSMHLISDAAYAMSDTVSHFGPKIQSEPEWAGNPLRGITKWGGNIVKTIADGIYSELGTGSAAAAALSGALVPNFGVPAFAGPTPMSVPTGGGPTWIVNVNGVERTVSSEQEAMDALRDLGAFGPEGRLSG
jgi:hypothetical protein